MTEESHSGSETAARGDPTGRRIARTRAGFLSEAGKVGQALKVLMARADVATDDVDAILKRLLDAEQKQWFRATGRIEPRDRFKGGPIKNGSIDEAHSLYIDESGMPVADGGRSFALGAVSLTASAAAEYCRLADSLKIEFFGNPGITFHEPDMRRRVRVFDHDGDADRQEAFDAALLDLLRQTPFVAFGIGIRKWGFAGDFVETGMDPYLPTDMYAVAIQLLMERYVDFLASQPNRGPRAAFIFEAQGPREDAQHQLDFATTLLHGTQWVSGKAFQRWLVTGAEFRPKQGSDPIEIADMLARDLFEWIEGDCLGSPGRMSLFIERFHHRGDGLHGSCGLKVFPDTDIRDRILEHRILIRAHKEAPTPEEAGADSADRYPLMEPR